MVRLEARRLNRAKQKPHETGPTLFELRFRVDEVPNDFRLLVQKTILRFGCPNCPGAYSPAAALKCTADR